MKLKKLKSVGHSTASSYMSTLSSINGNYATTIVYRYGLKNGLKKFTLDVLKEEIEGDIRHKGIENSLKNLKLQFYDILKKEGLTEDSVTSYKPNFIILGNQRDIIDIQCEPKVIDLNGKLYECAYVREKYPESIT